MRAIVIGAGLLGVTTAYFLRRDGWEVTVVDRAEGPGLETSFANASMLTPSLSDPWNSPGVFWRLVGWIGQEDAPILLRPRTIPSLLSWGSQFIWYSRPTAYWRAVRVNLALARYSLEVMDSLRAEDHIEYEQSLGGTLKIFRSRESLDVALEMASVLNGHGLQSRVLQNDEVVELEPALADCSSQLIGGIHYPADEVGDAYKFCQEMYRIGASIGVEFSFRTTIKELAVSRSRVIGTHCDNGRTIAGDAFVLAAGSHSPGIARRARLRLPIRPVKGYSITLPAANWAGRPRLPVLDDDLHAAVVPLGSRIRVAGTAELAGYDRTVMPGRIENLWRLLTRVFPASTTWLDRTRIEPWAGLRPMSPDGVPIIGRSKIENLFLNTGHGHLGWSMAAGSARLLADSMSGRSTAIPLDPYDIGRFWNRHYL